MITLRRSAERRHDARGKRQTWCTFAAGARPDPLAAGFGALVTLDEVRLPPAGALAVRTGDDVEFVSYVYWGALAQSDSTGSSGVVHAGEFQRLVIGHGVRHKETNASRGDWVHVFRLGLRPPVVGLEPSREQQRFAAAQRRNVLCAVASPDGRRGSLRVLADALVCSSVLDPGRHLIHELGPGRSAWLHLVRGEVTLQDIVLTDGDGVGVTLEPAISITAQESAEILLVDLGPAPPTPAGGARS